MELISQNDKFMILRKIFFFFFQGINSITSLSCISTVDYMIAAGNQTGLVTIFQIPRDLPPDHSNVSPEVQFEFEKKVKV